MRPQALTQTQDAQAWRFGGLPITGVAGTINASSHEQSCGRVAAGKNCTMKRRIVSCIVAAATGDAIKASVYARPGKCLLVAVNTDTRTEHTASVRVDRKALGLPDDCAVLDAETNTPFPAQPGHIELHIAPREVRYLYLVAPQADASPDAEKAKVAP